MAAAPIRLRTSSTSSLSKTDYTQSDSSSSDANHRFGDALKSAQAKSDAKADNKANRDTASPHAADKTKSDHPAHSNAKHTDKTESGSSDTATDATDADAADAAAESAAAAKSSDTPEAQDTDETTAKAKAPATPAEKPAAPSNAELSAAASQNTVATPPVVQPPPPQKTAAVTTPPADQAATVDVSAGEKTAPPKRDLMKDAAKGANLPAPKNADSSAPNAKQLPRNETPSKAADSEASEQPAEPLAISKPAKNSSQDNAAADAKDSSQQNTQSQQSTSAAQPSTPNVSSQAIATTLSNLPANPEHEPAPVAHDNSLGISSIGTAPPASPQVGNRAEAAADAQEPQPAEQDPTFEQIVMGLRGKLDPRSGKAEIRLDPPNLGTLRVSINLDKGSLTAQFQSGSSSVRDLLKGNMEKLKMVLESHGVSVDKLSVESPAEKPGVGSGSTPSGTASHDGRSAGEYTQDRRSGQKRPEDAEAFSRLWKNATTEEAPIDLVA